MLKGQCWVTVNKDTSKELLHEPETRKGFELLSFSLGFLTDFSCTFLSIHSSSTQTLEMRVEMMFLQQ